MEVELVAILSWTAQTMVSGVLGNRADALLTKGWNALTSRFTESKIPALVDIRQAVSLARWSATHRICNDISSYYRVYSGGMHVNYINKLEKASQKRITNLPDEGIATIIPFQPDILLIQPGQPFREFSHQLQHYLLTNHIQEIDQLLGEPMPEGIRRYFSEGWPEGGIGPHLVKWDELAPAFFSSFLNDPRQDEVRNAFQNSVLVALQVDLAYLGRQNQDLLSQFRVMTELYQKNWSIEGQRKFNEQVVRIQDSLVTIYAEARHGHVNTQRLLERQDRLEEAIQQVLRNLNPPNSQRLITGVPFLNAALVFVGRHADIRQVFHQLDAYRGPVLIQGMKGLGKTTLVRVLTKLLLDQPDRSPFVPRHIAWLNGADLLIDTIERIGRQQPGLRKRVEKALSEPTLAFSHVLTYLQNLSGPNLLIIDNLTEDNLTVFEQFQQLANWRILVTSYELFNEGFVIHQLDLLCLEEARDVFYSHHPCHQDAEVNSLLSSVGRHTLTVELLAKTARDLQLEPVELVQRLEDKGLAISQQRLRLRTTHGNADGVLPYLEVLFDLVRLNEPEKELLLQFAVLPPQPLSFETLRNLLQISHQSQAERDAFAVRIQELVYRGWLLQTPVGYYLHEVIQELIRRNNPPSAEKCEILLTAIGQQITERVNTNPFAGTNLIPIASTVLNHFKTDDWVTWIYNDYGILLDKWGYFEQALKHRFEALERYRRQLPESHPIIATCFLNIGNSYASLGQHQFALDYSLKALAHRRKHLPRDHPDIAAATENVGLSYGSLGYEEKALRYELKAYQQRKRTLPADHPDFIISLTNIGNTYDRLGQPKKGLSYKQKALAQRQRQLPADHPDLAFALLNVGVSYANLGQYNKALEHEVEALRLFRAALPENHPEITATLNDVAKSYYHAGQFTQALAHWLEVFDRQKRLTPNDQAARVTTLENISDCYIELGDHQQSIDYKQQALKLLQRILPENHPDLIKVYQKIGFSYRALGQYEKALTYRLTILNHRRKALPENHIDIANSLSQVGNSYTDLGNFESALTYKLEALAYLRRILPADHADIAIALSSVGLTYLEIDKRDKALDYLLEGLTHRQNVLPSDHPDIGKSHLNVALIFELLNNRTKAVFHAQAATNIFQSASPLYDVQLQTARRILRGTDTN